jgi:hypothetical protein
MRPAHSVDTFCSDMKSAGFKSFRLAVLVGGILLTDSVAVSSLDLPLPQPEKPPPIPVMLLTNGDGSALAGLALAPP